MVVRWPQISMYRVYCKHALAGSAANLSSCFMSFDLLRQQQRRIRLLFNSLVLLRAALNGRQQTCLAKRKQHGN
ncbi:hypothetical protein [Noviherbaspirillum sp. Root189]|uniref:hypothetical protein n=1 Tax=Noviherbaspirillum sp. Root189 TaxID=1736487 RepID=UPI0012E376B6|nr:hypothetical protein [Noviherbaspirillum sp. Root189]